MKDVLFFAKIAAVAAIVVFSSFFATDRAEAQVNLFSSSKGDILFPGLTPSTIDNMAIGQTTPAPGNFSLLSSSGGLPTIANGACGTGTNGAVIAGSTNNSMKITIGAAATTTCTISFSSTLSIVPKACGFSPMNAAAIGASTLPFISAPTSTGVVLNGSVLQSTNWEIDCL